MAMTKPGEVGAKVCEPTIAPDPVTEKRIHAGSDGAAVEHERGEFPAFRQRARRNGCCRIHKYHLEEEEGKRRSVITRPLKQESFPSKQAKELACDGDA